MKNLIKQILKEYTEEQEKILTFPSLKIFNNDWNALQQFLKSRGNPKWKILGDLDLTSFSIESLGNLTSVGGSLDLYNTPISKKYTEEEVREMVNVEDNIYI